MRAQTEKPLATANITAQCTWRITRKQNSHFTDTAGVFQVLTKSGKTLNICDTNLGTWRGIQPSFWLHWTRHRHASNSRWSATTGKKIEFKRQWTVREVPLLNETGSVGVTTEAVHAQTQGKRAKINYRYDESPIRMYCKQRIVLPTYFELLHEQRSSSRSKTLLVARLKRVP